MTLLELADWALSRARDEAHTITDPSKADKQPIAFCDGCEDINLVVRSL